MEDKKLLIFMELFEACKDKNQRATLLQAYVQRFGPIPDEYGDKIRELLDH